MEQPTISVIVPVYNVEKYLSECIESIINQTFTDLEIILINDGSTDRSGEICDEYALKDNRIKVIHKENGGLSSARNTGIESANGKFIFFIDSDDFITLDACEVLIKHLVETDADIVQGKGIEFTEQKSLFQQNDYSSIKYIEFQNIDGMYNLIDYTSGVLRIVSWNKLYKRELFNNELFPIGKIHEDEYLTPRLFYKANKIVFVDYYTYYYRLTEDSIMRSKFTIKKLDKLDICRKNLTFFNNIQEKKIYEFKLLEYSGIIIDLYECTYYSRESNAILLELRTEFKEVYKELKKINLNYKNKFQLFCFRYFPKLICYCMRKKRG